MCGGTTHPRMTTAPRLILGAMARAVTTADLSTLLMFRRIPVPLSTASPACYQHIAEAITSVLPGGSGRGKEVGATGNTMANNS